ncbi:alpha/beta hydrolase [Rhodococcus pyridinivorans]|uniref:alpha/beta hydrolase n=1 Tax=Rhodococcus pyridinivorans TaxID=103816 RepID=UPI001E2F0393|nr:alpha/beta hydrolase [Rhodococcus pyridinivorans]MCD5422435.1 alpha/beta hydrolase [Rhodococcus pyridinivorans]
MKREEHTLGDIASYRFPGPDADHALLVLHGTGGHGGIYDSFAAHHANRGVDIWCMDAPGHGRSCITRPAGRFTLEEWVEAAVAYGEHIAKSTGLPVFVKGSSLGAAAAYPALAADVFAGAVLMGYAIPGSPLLPADNPFRSAAYEQIEKGLGQSMRLDISRFFDFDVDYGYVGAAEQKHADPLNTWFYDMASYASVFRYDPPVPLSENTKPILYAVGEKDPTFPVSVAQSVVDITGGPVEFHIEPDGVHQLMLFHTQSYSKLIHEWCSRHLNSEGR